MFNKTYQATHPSMIDGIGNESLRDLYLVRTCSSRTPSA